MQKKNSIPFKINIFSFLNYAIKPYKIYIILMFIFFLATVADRTAMPYLFKIMINKIEKCTDNKSAVFKSITINIATIAIVALLIETSCRIKGMIEAFIIPKFKANIRMTINNLVKDYPLGYFLNNHIGMITKKINDIPDGSENVIITMIEIIVPAIFAGIISIILLSKLNLYIGIFFTIWFISHIAVTTFLAKKCAILSDIHASKLSKLTGIMVDSMKNIMNIRLFGRSKYESSYISKYQKIEEEANHAAILVAEKIKIIISILTVAEYSGAIFMAVIAWKNNLLTIGDVVFVFDVSTNIVSLLWWLSLESPFFFKNIGIITQGLSVLNFSGNATNTDGEKVLIVKKGDITFKNVCFSYSHKRQIFENLNIKIQGGTKVGLVGFSGSGKSTFINLIQRFYRIDAGEITIDGQPINELTNDSIIQNISIVPQNVALFQRTIAENILYANKSATHEDMINASKQAFCHDFILKTENGYETIISDTTPNISGGQRQLIGIARAIIKNSPILILDEATSALDSSTEMKIKQILHTVTTDKTVIVIAHRLSTLTEMDRILVFDNGKIIEDGTHSELLLKDSCYAFLWKTSKDGLI